MTLTTKPGGIGCKEVEEICQLKDAVYRNCWITFGYYELSRRLGQYIGNNASWSTFARWSSATVGESLRLDLESRRLNDVFRRRYLRPFRGVAQDVYREARTISDAAMPRVLAQGNHFVFHEIGHAVAGFLDWFEQTSKVVVADNDETWNEEFRIHREQIRAFELDAEHEDHFDASAQALFRRADLEWLRRGIECYFRATRPGITPDEQGRHVLRGNILLAAYEQWRLDPVLRIALDPFAKHLVEFQGTDLHDETAPGDFPRAVLIRPNTRWALKHQSALRRWVGEKYGGMLTRFWMTLNVPIDTDELTAIVLGSGVPDDAANAAYKRQRRLEDEDITKLVAIFDHNPERRTRGARNWCNFAERMQFIVELFLALQKNDRLYAQLPPSELELLRLDLDDTYLNEEVQTICDPAMDDYVEEHVLPGEDDPRALVHRLIRSGLPRSGDDEMQGAPGGELPAWAQDKPRSDELLVRGQTFFRDNALEIATALFTASLPLTYTARRGARVLTETAELTSGNITRRVAETGRMLLDLMTIDEGTTPMHPGTTGWDAARGVRMFHAAVRHMLWDRNPDEKGFHPINQEDLLGALVAFTVVVLDSLEKMGVRVSTEDREAYVYLWMVTGALLGIDYSLVHRDEGAGHSDAPLTLPELRLLGTTLWRRNARATPEGQTLTAALMHMFRDTMRGPLRDLPPAATRILIGDESGDLLEVPNAGAPARLAIRVGRPITQLVSRGRLAGFLPKRVQSRTLSLYQQWITTNRGDRPPWRVEDPHLQKQLRLRCTESPATGRRKRDAQVVIDDSQPETVAEAATRER